MTNPGEAKRFLLEAIELGREEVCSPPHRGGWQVGLCQSSTGHALAELDPPTPPSTHAIRFTTDSGRLLVASTSRIHVWDLLQRRRELSKLGLDPVVGRAWPGYMSPAGAAQSE